MSNQPELPNQSEYYQARKIMEYNQSVGNMNELNCSICNNKGNIMKIGDIGEEILCECECMRKRRTIRNAKLSGMGGLLHKTFDNFDTTEKWQRTLKNGAEFYLQNSINDWFCMLGQSGAGKTHLCSAVTNSLINNGKKTIYMLWNNTVKELKRNATDQQEYTRLFNRYAKCDVLYIDDFFKGKITETDVTIAFELINYRYNNQDQITIISSELSLNDLINIDVALAGRIKERCGRYFIEIAKDTTKNYRFKDVTLC